MVFNALLKTQISKQRITFFVQHKCKTTLQSHKPNWPRLVKRAISTLIPSTVSYVSVAKSASPELWTLDFPPQYIRLDGVANIGQMKTLSLEDEGHPTAEESNHCIGLLLANCTAPTECVHIETSDNSSGYALTHQTLYFQIARAVSIVLGNLQSFEGSEFRISLLEWFSLLFVKFFTSQTNGLDFNILWIV